MNYIPSDKENESASKTLEYCFDDWCLAQVAKKLGHIDDYERYMKRSGNYKNLYDPESGFIRGRLSTGEWAEPFDPRFHVIGMIILQKVIHGNGVGLLLMM